MIGADRDLWRRKGGREMGDSAELGWCRQLERMHERWVQRSNCIDDAPTSGGNDKVAVET